jgi:hypothetical protein
MLRALYCGSLLLTLAACAELGEAPPADFDEADYWDSGLVYHQYIDVATLSSGFSSQELVLSGFVSSVAAKANDLYFIDEGAGQLVQVDLATMTARSIISMQGPFTPGLSTDIDGNVYAIDRANDRLLVYFSVTLTTSPFSVKDNGCSCSTTWRAISRRWTYSAV